MTGFRDMILRPALVALALLPAAAPAAPSLDPLYGDHAVLQRGRPARHFGAGGAGRAVRVTLGSATANAIADTSGRWQANLPAMAAGGPFVLTASSAKGSASASDMLIGDVWLCAGQSNMEYALAPTVGSGGAIASSKDDQLRLVTIPKTSAPVPARDFGTPAIWGGRLAGDHARLLGGLLLYGPGPARDAKSADRRDQCKLGRHADPRMARSGGIARRLWRRRIGHADSASPPIRSARRPSSRRAGKAGGARRAATRQGQEPWNAPDRLAWKPVPAIAYWESWPGAGLDKFDGMIWFRKTVTLTAAQAKQGAMLSLGIFDELDQTWVNGKAVGNSFGWDYARNYKVPPAYLHGGKNEI